MSEAKRLRGGIIGCGFFAQFQIDGWRRMEDVELAAACDLDISRAKAAAPRAYTDPEAMLRAEALDFVDIATRPESHLELVRLALHYRVPVICQKPMAPTWRECVAMADEAQASGIPVMIHENWRWQPWYRHARRLIEDGAIGSPVAYTFRTRRRDGLGPEPYPSQPYFRTMPRLLTYETLVHHIDTARYLFGSVASVYAQARRLNPSIAGEDAVLMAVRHTSGVDGCIDGHRFSNADPEGPVMGDATFDGDEAVLSITPAGDIYRDSELVWRNDVHEGYRGDSVRATQQHFIKSLKGGWPMESGAREYLATVGVVEAAYESMARQCSVEPWRPAATDAMQNPGAGA